MEAATNRLPMAHDFAPSFVGLLAGLQTPLEAYLATSAGYLLDGLNVRSIIPVSKVETAIRDQALKMCEGEK